MTVDVAKEARAAAPRGFARKAANTVLKTAIKNANETYLDQSYILLGKTLTSGAGATMVIGGYCKLRQALA